ncbi:hypothetical protein [Rhizobium sp.]
MPALSETDQPKILVIQNEFVAEMRLALEYAGKEGNDPDAIRDQMAFILKVQDIGAAILDTGLELEAATTIADTLLELDIPFVFAGTGEANEMPEHVIVQTMAPDLANLTVLGQSILGRPTYH